MVGRAAVFAFRDEPDFRGLAPALISHDEASKGPSHDERPPHACGRVSRRGKDIGIVEQPVSAHLLQAGINGRWEIRNEDL